MQHLKGGDVLPLFVAHSKEVVAKSWHPSDLSSSKLPKPSWCCKMDASWVLKVNPRNSTCSLTWIWRRLGCIGIFNLALLPSPPFFPDRYVGRKLLPEFISGSDNWSFAANHQSEWHRTIPFAPCRTIKLLWGAAICHLSHTSRWTNRWARSHLMLDHVGDANRFS